MVTPPSPELLERLREDKRRALTPAGKVQRVIELQRIVLPQIAPSRPLRYYEAVRE